MAEKQIPDLYGMADDEADFLRLARLRYEAAVDAERENREQALEDLEFRAGEQWPEGIRQEREEDGRPCLTINRMPQFIRQVTGDIRLNRPSIKVRPVDDAADIETAEVFTGIIRHIEHASNAHIAYTTAADASATCGMGHFRIVTEYADDDVFDQDIRIERMPNPFSVLWDPAAQKLDKSDARWCLVTDMVSREAFEEEWPDASTSEFDMKDGIETLRDWRDNDSIRIAEYWLKVPVKKTLGQTEDGRTIDITDGVPDDEVVVRERPCDGHKVVQYLISGAEILDGPTEWAGKNIPIIPVVGEEIHIGERTVRHGVIRFAKDPQRLYNYWRSATAESIAHAPKAPFIVAEGQVKGLENQWKAANRSNLPYLKYKPVPDAPMPQRTTPPQISSAMLSEIGAAADDMKAVTGIYDPSLGNRSNETSGRAILARQREGDVGTFVYVDNLAYAIASCGRQLVELIPKIYDGERAVRILGEDDSEDFVRLNVPVPGDDGQVNYMTAKRSKDGTLKLMAALDAGKYDVAVTTGPSYSTKRMESAESIMAFIQAAPQAAQFVLDLLAKNLDWPGADQIADRLRRLVPPQVLEDAPPQPQAPPPPDPKAMAAMAKLEIDKAKADADITKTRAETEQTQLENAQKQIELAGQIGALQDVVRQTVEQTLMRVLGAGAPAPGPVAPMPGEMPGAMPR